MSLRSLARVDTLLRLLADGKFHSGQSIAIELGVSRTAIWKMIQKIQSWQLEVYSVRGRGYQIPGGLKLIDEATLAARVRQNNRLFRQVKVLTSIDSTADYLARDWKQSPGEGRVCIAEHQTKGRGRKGRPWVSPFARNLYFSIGVQLPLGLSALGGVSLAVGICLCRLLNRVSHQKISIKWPNDLLLGGRKLAGILVEASGDSNDSSFLNIGVGLNWNMPEPLGSEIDQPWCNLSKVLSPQISRNQVLADMLLALDQSLRNYLDSGLDSFISDWPDLSACFEQRVTIFRANQQFEGVETGIDSSGALRLKTGRGTELILSGEVSLRRVEHNP